MRERHRSLPLLLTTIAAAAALLAPPAGAAAPRPAFATTHLGDTLVPFDALTGAFGAAISLTGDGPWGVAITPDGATAYVAATNAGTVIPIDTATGVPGTPIPVGSSPRTIGIAPDGRTAYVADIGSDDVTPIDLATNTAGTPIAVGSGPHGIAISPDGSRVYVADIFSGTVSVIDTATSAVVATIPGFSDPYTLAIAPNGATVYVTSPNSNDVTPIDTATNTAGTPIDVGAPTFGIAISPDGATAYVTQQQSGHIVPIDTATNTAGTPIAIGTGPEGIAIDPDGHVAWVTDTGSGVDTIAPLDLATGISGTPVHVGQAPMTIAITPDKSPAAAFSASVSGVDARLDASASSDPDGSVASYAWDFGDGQRATTSQPTTTHAYAQPGVYKVALTVTDDEGCSQALVFTGQTASCTGSAAARVTHAVTIAAPPADTPPAPPATTTPAPTVPAPRQAIERFTLDHRCVRLGRDGTARVGLRLRLALPGAVQIQVDRAIARFNTHACPKPSAARFRGSLRRFTTLGNVAPQVAAASVRATVTRSFALPAGLYRIGVRAYRPGGGLTRPAYRWVRVLARSR